MANQLKKSSSTEEKSHLVYKIKVCVSICLRKVLWFLAKFLINTFHFTCIQENGNCKRHHSPPKRKACDERTGHSIESNGIDCSKNGRLRSMAEIKQAFTEDEILGNTLDSDFNEDSFGNLLDSDDAFQPDLRNSMNGMLSEFPCL